MSAVPVSPHVALVSWGFPPFRGSGTFRPLALANALAAAGARVSVIAAARETFLLHYGADPALESQIDSRVVRHRVPWWPENHWPVVNDWGPIRSRDSAGFARTRNALVPPFPEKVYDTWLPRVQRTLHEVAKADPVDVIIGTGAPYGDLEAAINVGSELGVPVVIDDRDAFLADVFTADTHPLFEQRLAVGRRWLRLATEAWFVNPPIADWHRNRFPEAADRIRVVENGWDPGVVDPGRIRAVPGERIRMGYVGLVPTNFPMDMVLAAWQDVRAASPVPAELVFVGPLGYEVDSPKWRSAADRISAAEGVSWQGHLSRTRLADVYADLDCLLLAKEGGALVTGGKTYEYAATGLPIAGVVDPDSDAVRVLGATPRFHPALAMDQSAAADAMSAAVADAIAGTQERLTEAQRAGSTLSRAAALEPAVERVLEMAAR